MESRPAPHLPVQVWSAVIRLTDISGAVEHHVARIQVREVCVPLAVVALCFSNAQDQTIPMWEEVNKIALTCSVESTLSTLATWVVLHLQQELIFIETAYRDTSLTSQTASMWKYFLESHHWSLG